MKFNAKTYQGGLTYQTTLICSDDKFILSVPVFILHIDTSQTNALKQPYQNSQWGINMFLPPLAW